MKGGLDPRIFESKKRRTRLDACHCVFGTFAHVKELGLDKITKHDGTKIDSLFADLDDMIKNVIAAVVLL